MDFLLPPNQPRASFPFLSILLLLASASCAIAPLPPANLQQPGWILRTGQAVWRAKTGAPEIAGDLLVGFRSQGDQIIQFTKTPFPFVTAQTAGRQWQLEIAATHQRYSGRGSPPAAISWFELARAIQSQPLGAHWRFEGGTSTGPWQLENRRTGESLSGYFAP